MAKKYPKSAQIENAENKNLPAYITWSNRADSKAKAMVQYSDVIDELTSVHQHRTQARYRRDYSNLDTRVSGRPGLTKDDYYAFRPDERVPSNIKGVIKQSSQAYKRVGIIRNIIDLMSDFTCQGIRLSHQNKRVEKFYRNWFKRVKGPERSERFSNNLYRVANVIVRRQTAKLKKSDIEKIFKSLAAEDIKQITHQQITKNEIPWQYTFLSPLTVEPIAGTLSVFLRNPQYQLKLSQSLISSFKSSKSAQRGALGELPREVAQAIRTSNPIPLDPEKTLVFHYKKDDWEVWASPMIESILDDIHTLEKLRLADMAALDGAISNIRIFKLGSLEERIMPSRAIFTRLAEILESHMGVGTMDLVWGPDIDLLESKTNVHEFLGEEKYRPTLSAIYDGLGIPSILKGGGGTGLTNNFLSIKTLIERLNYGRTILVGFWEREIEMVRKAMGFRFPAKVEFDHMSLANEEAEKALLIQLADRNLISDELLHHRFKNDPELERIRINREAKDRTSGKLVRKAGPWHDPQFDEALKKIALQQQMVSLEQLSVEIDRDAPPPILPQPQTNDDPNKQKKGEPQQGRPKLSQDKQKRKQKQVNPQTKSVLELWAGDAQNQIAEMLNGQFLKQFDKSNMRSLTAEETEVAENIKFGVLFHIEPLSVITKEGVVASLNIGAVPKHIKETYRSWKNQLQKTLGRQLTLDECRKVRAHIYINMFLEEVDA